MIKILFSTILANLLVVSIVSGQKNNHRFFYSGSEIVVDVLPGNDIYFPITMEKGITIYSLAKTFQVSTQDIYSFNGIDPNLPISEGKIVNIPLKRKRVSFKEPKTGLTTALTYIVKPKETLYGISKTKFGMSVEDVLRMNDLKDNQLKIGMPLKIGWYNLENTPSGFTDIAATTVGTNEPEIGEWKKSEEATVLVKEKVIGMWDKNIQSVSGLFILYNNAKPGTIVDLYFPMLHSTIKAEVIGRLPDNTYPSDIEIFISPEVAKKLRIFDRRFKVEVRFYKPV